MSAIQQAIYTKLTGNAPLMAAIVGVYDQAPQNIDGADISAFPFVNIGEDTVANWSTNDWSGYEATISVHVWSRYRGFKEAKDIQALIRTALHRTALTVSGSNHVNTEFETQTTVLDNDGVTRHGIQTFRVLLS